MRLISKLSIIFVSVTILRLVSGCCNCENEYYTFSYERIIVHNIDNSGQWSKPSDVNRMPAAGVAFEVQILGSEPILSAQNKLQSFGFNALNAQTCNCDEIYRANHTISAIKIRTLENLNSDYCCNEEVTDLFLANSCLSCNDIGNFYITLDELITRINPEAFYQTPVNKFLIYLKVPVENTEAQFEIEVILNNGESIISQTSKIEII